MLSDILYMKQLNSTICYQEMHQRCSVSYCECMCHGLVKRHSPVVDSFDGAVLVVSDDIRQSAGSWDMDNSLHRTLVRLMLRHYAGMFGVLEGSEEFREAYSRVTGR